ncbi:hypothetical protein FB451DRAFT_1229857 [Mycena latifolia]|nr:hypothetical protein FB451DRAFT_1229857 [Mycena latifolia]
MPVRQILSAQRATLRKLLCREDFAALADLKSELDVYLPQEQLDEKGIQLTLAVDALLSTRSTCPPAFLPHNPNCRNAWRKTQGETLMRWFSACKCFPNFPTHLWIYTPAAPRKDLYMVICRGPTKTTDADADDAPPDPTAWFFLSLDVVRTKDSTPAKPKFRVANGGRQCPLCDSKSCGNRVFHKINSLLDLPPHFSRQIWLQHRRGAEWPTARATKTGKKARSKED